MVEKDKLVCPGALGNSDLKFSDRLQVSKLEKGAEVAAAGCISVLSTVRLVGTRRTFDHQAYCFNQSGGLRACSQQLLCAGGLLPVKTT